MGSFSLLDSYFDSQAFLFFLTAILPSPHFTTKMHHENNLAAIQ